MTKYRLDVVVKTDWTFAVEADSLTDAYAALNLKEKGYEPAQEHLLIEDGTECTELANISDIDDEDWNLLKANYIRRRKSF